MDNKQETKPTFLDGLVTGRGQGQEGNLVDMESAMFRAFIDNLKLKEYQFYITYPGKVLTDDDYISLWQMSSRMCTSRDMLKGTEIIAEKVDMEASLQFQESYLRKQREQAKKSNHAGHELGAREFTLTYSPKWFDDNTARDLFRKAIDKLIKYYHDDIISLRAVGEVGSNGLSHVHCFYKIRGGLKITDKNFKRAYKYWNPKKVTSRTGHEGGHHANVRNESDFQGYIDKDVDEAWLDIYFPVVADPR